MAPTVYVSDLNCMPSRSYLYPDTLDVFLGGGLRVRRRPHRPPRGNKEHRTRGSIWLQSPQMGLTAEESRHQVMSREEEEATISTNSISIDSSSSSSSSSSSHEDSSNSIYRSGSAGEDSQDSSRSSSSDKDENSWNRDEILHHQQQQCQRLLLLRRREGLLDITMRTVNLMRRNQQLQYRLAALQAETRAFVRSVLNNPENQAIRVLSSKSRERSRSEDEDEDNCSKRLKIDDDNNTITTTIATTTSVKELEQDPSISESDGNEK